MQKDLKQGREAGGIRIRNIDNMGPRAGRRKTIQERERYIEDRRRERVVWIVLFD